MPKSKRVKVVSLTKTGRKDKDFKTAAISTIRDNVENFSNIFVFSFENMRTAVFKDVRIALNDSKIFLGKNKVAQVALGKSEEDEYRSELRRVSAQLKGDSGLIFTERTKENLEEYFSQLKFADYARAGVIPRETIVIKPGPLEFPGDMLDQLRKLGMVVEIDNGVVVLRTEFRATTKGSPLTPEQAKVLIHMGKKLSVFRVSLKCAWKDGDFKML
jgi:mRNA turnover protein 4